MRSKLYTQHIQPLKLATSSKDLKDRGVRQSAPPDNLVSNPKTSAKKRSVADLQAAARRLTKSPSDEEKETEEPVFRSETSDTEGGGELCRLMQAIDERLLSNQRGSNSFAVDFVQYPRDPMGALLEYNNMKDEKATKAARQIFVLFGKPLMNDQVTVEYAARIRSLAMLLQEKKTMPDLVCFCGGVRKNNHISDADAGFMFFKHLCMKGGISLQNIKIFIDRTSRGERKALQNVVSHIKSEHVVEWLAVSNNSESLTDEYGMQRRALRKKIDLHFTLISTEYHLCNFNDIHHRSPNQSLLRPIEMLRTKDHSQDGIMSEYDDELNAFQHKLHKGRNQIVNGIVDCSWSYKYASYPYSYLPDITSSFTGRCYLFGEKLRPLLVNIKGVVEEREFLQRDNFVAASAIRHKLVALMEGLYKTSPGLRSGLRELSTYSDSKETVDIVLEGATLSLGRCIDLLRPAGLHKSSVSKTQFTKALRSLDHCMTQIRTYCDPDQPLALSEWGSMEQSFDKDEPEESSTGFFDSVIDE